MNKFAKKATAAAITATMLFSTIAPAAATVITADDGRFPEVGSRDNAIVLELQDTTSTSGRSLQDLYKRINFSEYERLYDLGDFIVYGSGKVAEDDPDFDQAKFDMSTIPDLQVWSAVLVDNSNTASTVYRTVVGESGNFLGTGKPVGIYTKEILDTTPRLDLNRLETMAKDTVRDTSAVGAYAAQFEDDLTLNYSSTSAQIGDPDALIKAYDEMYIYLLVDGKQYAFYLNLELNTDHDSTSNDAEVQNLKLAVRNQTGRVTFDLPEDPTGIVDFLVQVTDLDNSAQDVEYLTQNTTMFFDGTTQADESEYSVTVQTINPRGVTSEGVDVTEYDEAIYFETGDVPSDMYLPDIAESVFSHHITTLYKLGIIDGYSNGDFGPDDNVTRAQLSKFIVNAFGIPMDLGGNMFPDVEMTSSLAPYVQSLKNAQIVGGYSNGNFGPDDEVTRGQSTKMIFRAAAFFDGDSIREGGNISFPDTDDSVFLDYIEALASYAQKDDNVTTDEQDNIEPIIKGYSNGDFGPDDALTRGQMAKIVLNAASMVEKYNQDETTRLEDSHLQDTFMISRKHGVNIAEANAYNCANGECFFRPFIMPVAVDDVVVTKNPATPTSAVDLSWNSTHLDDSTIDGYVVEYKEAADSDEDWEPIDPVAVADGEWLLTVTKANVANGTVSLFLTAGNGQRASFVYTADTVCTAIELATDVSDELDDAAGQAALLTPFLLEDENGAADGACGVSTYTLDTDLDEDGVEFLFADTVVATVDNVDATVTITGPTGGDTVTALSNIELRTSGGNAATLELATAPTSAVTLEGLIFVDAARDGVDANPYANMVTVTGLSDGEKYNFRIAPFKYVPVGWTGNQDITTTAALELEADEEDDGVYENLIVGPYKSISRTVSAD